MILYQDLGCFLLFFLGMKALIMTAHSKMQKIYYFFLILNYN